MLPENNQCGTQEGTLPCGYPLDVTRENPDEQQKQYPFHLDTVLAIA